MKLVLAGRTGLADPRALIDRQRRAYLQACATSTGCSPTATATPRALLIEGAALHLEADLRWLALCEERLTAEVTHGARPAH